MTEDEEFETNIENSPEFILSQVREGTVITEKHVKAIASILNTLENDLHDDAATFQEGRLSGIREIGGEELVTAVQLKDEEHIAKQVRKFMDLVFPKRTMQ